jgi:non-ribosomal peptide synthetase component F
MLQAASFAFDASLAEIFFALLSGGCICIPSDDERANDLEGSITRMHINWAILTPSMARLLSPTGVPTLQNLALVGEAMTEEDAAMWKGIRLVNAYGPAEDAIISSCTDNNSDAAVSCRNVGRPYGCLI